MSKKPVVLMILDGYGLNDNTKGNGIAAANTPVMDKLMKEYPYVKGYASGLAVGLPDGQMGNSEVGHLNMGAGRIVYQELTRITKEIQDGTFFENPALLEAVNNCKKNDSALHMFGLLSDGGVHSHITHLYGLLEMAKKRNLNFMFEASVGGGIPIIRPLNQSLTADEITKITGILNGTTNYILTKMDKEGSTYEETLKEAQELGYAERNPEADVEGFDACRKIAILTSLAYGSTVKFEEIRTEGITKITTKDFKYAGKLGYVVKLLATSCKENDKVYAITAPFMINSTHPLYNVNDVLNGIYIHGNVIGNVMFFGAGAGKLPTASAVVADVVDCVKHKGKNVMTVWSVEKLELGDADDEVRKFFVRVKGNVSDLSAVNAAFGNVQTVTVDGIDGEFGFITEPMSERAFAEAAKKIDMIHRIRIDETTI